MTPPGSGALSPDALAAARALVGAVTPGEWRAVHWIDLWGGEQNFISTVDDTQEGVAAAITVAKTEFPNRYTRGDFAFIAAAPQLVRDLLDTLEAQRVPVGDEVLATLRTELATFEAEADEREHAINKVTHEYQDNWQWWEGVAEGIERCKPLIAALEAQVRALQAKLDVFERPC